jgi:hypothetical protein
MMPFCITGGRTRISLNLERNAGLMKSVSTPVMTKMHVKMWMPLSSGKAS